METSTLPQPSPVASPSVAIAPASSQRVVSVDAYRGFVMFLMMAEVLRLSRVAQAIPGSKFWQFLASQQEHVEWVGCSLHDLIQPSFSFLVGVALTFSIVNRRARGQAPGRLWLHAWWRALVLILLGVFLRSTSSSITNWTFEDTLTQIGLGYGFLFLLGLRPAREQWLAFGLIVAGYWAAFVLYPVAPAGFDYASVNVSAEWLKAHGLSGLAAHWQKNSNLAWHFDTWFLNLFRRTSPFVCNKGGYATLSFIPTLATMILGLLAGNVLKKPISTAHKVRWLLLAGVIGLASGWVLNALGACPVVKRVWSPAWVLFSGGWCFVLLGSFYFLLDSGRPKGWAMPLVVIGANSIAAYLMAHLFQGFIERALLTHLGETTFRVFGPAYRSLVEGSMVLAVFWLMLFWMYRRKVFLKV